MSDDDRLHKIELRQQKLEARIVYGGAALIAIATVFGVTGVKTLFDARDKLEQRIEEISEAEIASELTELLDEARSQAIEAEVARSAAEAHAVSLRSLRSVFCPDDSAFEAFGSCIFQETASGGHYGLNYGAASAVCAANRSQLCELSEVREAYNNGFSICAWGWVAELETKSTTSGTDATYNRSGTLVQAITSQNSRRGCPAGFSVRRGQNILTQNANAFCCQ